MADIAQQLEDCADDPMYAYRAEVSKDLLRRAASRIRELEQDAARYRWLRRCRGMEHDPLFTVRHEIDGTLWGADLDNAIDAARGESNADR